MLQERNRSVFRSVGVSDSKQSQLESVVSFNVVALEREPVVVNKLIDILKVVRVLAIAPAFAFIETCFYTRTLPEVDKARTLYVVSNLWRVSRENPFVPKVA